jgi:hypothetical protein
MYRVYPSESMQRVSKNQQIKTNQSTPTGNALSKNPPRPQTSTSSFQVPPAKLDSRSQNKSSTEQSRSRSPNLWRYIATSISSLQCTSNRPVRSNQQKHPLHQTPKLSVNLRSRQRRKRNRRKRHPQPRPHNIQIRGQTRYSCWDEALERSVDDSVEARENVKAARAVDGQPGPGDDCYAE